MAAQIFAESTAQDTHTGAVNDTYARKPGKEGTIDEARNLVVSLVGGTANHVDLRAYGVRIVVGRDRDAAAFSRGFERGDSPSLLDLGDVIERDAHLHGADRDLEGLRVDDSLDA